MNVTLFLIDVLKYALSGLVVLFVAFYIAGPYLEQVKTAKIPRSKNRFASHTMPLRLQAYERIILFIERINPSSLLLRIHVTDMSAYEMQHMILSEIKNEFQHNIAQQLYISNQSWSIVKKIKDDTISLINTAYNSLPESASALDLNKAVLMHLAGLQNSPYENALILIKGDIQGLF